MPVATFVSRVSRGARDTSVARLCAVRAELGAGLQALQDTVQCTTSGGCTATASFTGWLPPGGTVVSAALTTLVQHIDAAGSSNYVLVRRVWRARANLCTRSWLKRWVCSTANQSGRGAGAGDVLGGQLGASCV